MESRSPAISHERGRGVLRAGLLTLVVVSAIPFGSVQPWAILTLQLWSLVLGAIAFWILWWSDEELERRTRLLIIPAGLILTVGVLQLAPASAGLNHALAPTTSVIREAVSRVVPEAATSHPPGSLSAADTIDAVLRLLAYVLVGLATAVAIREENDLKQAAFVLASSGAVQALYGLIEYLSGHQHIFSYAKRYYLEEATGTLINRNHFSAYLAMMLPFALALVVGDARAGVARRTRWSPLPLGEARTFNAIFGACAAAIIWIGILLSYSRGGLAAAVVATTAFALIVLRRPQLVAAITAALLIPTLILLWQDIRAPGERFLAPGRELVSLNNRWPVWRSAVHMIPDYSPLGTGLGTFEGAFIPYKPASVNGNWEHAHNDWLQSLIEGGPLVLSSFLVLVGLACASGARSPRSSLRTTLRASATAGIFGIVFMSLTDFSLRVPAIALLAVLLVGIRVNSNATPRHVHSQLFDEHATS